MDRPVAVDIQIVLAEFFGMGRIEVAPGLQVGYYILQMRQPGGDIAQQVGQRFDPGDQLVVGGQSVGGFFAAGMFIQGFSGPHLSF